jgi:lycopene cyclase domain-containing protein
VAVIAITAVSSRRAPRWVAMAITLGVLLVMTAIFDNVMIGIGLVGYDRALISGILIGRAPLEDFAYAVAAAVLLPSLWTLLARKRDRV